MFRQKNHEKWHEKLSEIEKFLQQALSQPRKNLIFECNDTLIAPSKEHYWEAKS